MGELSPEQTFNAGGAVLAAILKRDQPPLFFRDDKEQTLSQQGEHLPLLIGRRRVAPIVGFTGVTTECAEISLSLFLRLATEGIDALAPAWCEEGTHWLCVGPIQALHMIYNDGTPVLIDTITGGPFPLTPLTLPSGQHFPLHVTIDLWADMLGIVLSGTPAESLTPFAAQLLDSQAQLTKNQQGVFYMYWGEPNQPINARMDFVSLATKLGLGGSPEQVSSRWPRIAYVHWDKKFLGAQPIWAAMEYDIECRPFNTGALIQSQRWLTRTPTNPDNPQNIEDAGANPAHALWQVLTGDYPYGMGLSPTLIDMPALEKLGVICEQEHLPVNILAKDGVDAASQIADILQDIGVVAAHLDHKLFFEAARPPDVSSPPPTLPADMILIPEAEQEIDHSTGATRYVLTFKDFRSRLRQSAVVIDDDGVSEAANRITEIKSTMPTITDEKTAQKVAQRRAAEALAGGGVFRFKLGRSARNFRPGTMFRVDGWGLLRVLTVQLQTDTVDASIDAVLDNYGVIDSGHRPEDVVGNDDSAEGLPIALKPDLAINWVEPPRSFYGVAPAIMPFRIAANTQGRYAHIRFQHNGPLFYFTGDMPSHHSGGTLNAALPAGGLTCLSPGPTITLVGGDFLQVLDLSEDDVAFRMGQQWALIGEEMWFVKSVTALGSNQFQLDEVIRGRFHTDQDAHAAGDVVIIAPRDDLQAYHHPRMDEVNNVPKPLVIKTAPFSPIGGVDHTGLPSAPHDFFGLDQGPWPVNNFRGNATTWSKDTYGTGDDILLEWTYRMRAGEGTGAGEGEAGVPIGTPPDGLQQIRIYEAGGFQFKHEFLVVGSSQNYTNAQLQSDFGSEPATFIARIRPIANGRHHKEREITITLV